MTLGKTINASDEALFAYLLGIGNERDNREIADALKSDPEIQSQYGFLVSMIPSASLLPAETESSDDTQVNLSDIDDTQSDSPPSVKHEKQAVAIKQMDDSDPEGDDHKIKLLDEQGYDTAEISKRLGMTRTLVKLRLRRIRKSERSHED